MPLSAGDIAELAQALQSLKEDSVNSVQAVALKLPSFWTAEPAVWFTQVEAKFNTHQPPIIQDKNKFDHVVQSLDNQTASEVKALLLSPPDAGKYEALKKALLQAFEKSQTEKDQELLNLSGLGDRKPTGLLRHIRSLNADPQTLLRALFLSQLPTEVRRVLAVSSADDLDNIATKADHIMEATAHDHRHVGISAARTVHPTRKSSETGRGNLCFYHANWGQEARKCAHKGCPLSHLVLPSSPAKSSSGNARAGC